MKKKFLLSWIGGAISGEQCSWVRAQGSSLGDDDKRILDEGGIITRPKCRELTKVFARDEDGNLWSIIVHNLHLATLEENLKKVGYSLAAA